MRPFARLTNELSKKMENYSAAEAVRLRKSSHGKLRLIGTAIGILVVILLALGWHITRKFVAEIFSRRARVRPELA